MTPAPVTSWRAVLGRWLPDRLVAGVRARIGVDPRALGAFRVGIAVVLVLDLLIRVQDIGAHYTDAGVLPRSAVSPAAVSVHMAAGDVAGVAALFAVQFLVAVALLVGYRSRVATVAAWLLWTSLHARMPLVLNGGDDLLRVLLFWSTFVPLGARFSVDAVRSGRRKGLVATAGTAALLGQVVVMYVVNAALKHHGDVWPRGDGVVYTMSLEQFTTPLGEWLATQPGLMTVLGVAVLVLWSATPLLFVLGGWGRAIVAAAVAAAQLGIGATMHVGVFPLVAIVAQLLFVPSVVWDRVVPSTPVTDAVPSWAETVAERWYPTVHGSIEIRFGDGTVSGRRLFRVAVAVVLVVSVAFTGLWNVQLVADRTGEDVDVVPDPLSEWGSVTRLRQYWTMFAPEPLRDDGWYVIPGRLANGSRIALYAPGPRVGTHAVGNASAAKPADVSAQYPNQRWRKYMMNLWLRSNSHYRGPYAAYLCRGYDRAHEVPLRSLEIRYVLERTGPDGDLPTETVTLWEHTCPTA